MQNSYKGLPALCRTPCNPEKLQQAWPGCEKICLYSQVAHLSWAALGRSLLDFQQPCYQPKPPVGAKL